MTPRRRILLVDDDRVVATAIARELADHEITIAHGGVEALDVLTRSTAFDLVICDLMMPEVSGIEVHGFVKMKDPYSDREVYVVPAIRPDWAILHVSEADIRGNARIYGTPTWDRLMSRAARRCILTTEKIVSTEYLAQQPELTVIPEIFVEAVVHAPMGAAPTGSFPEYDVDEDAMRHYLDLSRTPEGLARYLQETEQSEQRATELTT